jgi:hypothetical protein
VIRILILLVGPSVLVPMLGCGSSVTSEADMRRLAIRRAADDDEVPAPIPTPRSAASDVSEPPVPTVGSTPSVSASSSAPAAATLAEPPPPTPPPEEPLSDSQRPKRSIDHLRRIAAAFQQYVSEKRYFPAPANYDDARRPLLSWRVELLPYLGYEQLYSHFRLNEPWDSPHNRQLLPAIPLEYQSPERFDDHTNYLVPTGANTLFPGPRGVGKGGEVVSRVEDGLENTVLLLEVDDDAAVPWTQPQDYQVDLRSPGPRLGSLRDGFLYLVWADGTVGQCSLDAARPVWRNMFCIDDGAPFLASLIHQTPGTAPATMAMATEANPDVPGAAAEKADGQAPSRTDRPTSPVRHSSAQFDPADATGPGLRATPGAARRVPVPVEAACERARQTLRRTYQEPYERAKSVEQRRQLARMLLDHAKRLEYGSAEHYVVLELCWKMAVATSDLTLGLQAAEQIAESFEVDPLKVKTLVVAATSETRLSQDANRLLLKTAHSMIDAAIAENRFDVAREIHTAAVAAARRVGDRRTIVEIVARAQQIADAQAAWNDTSHAIKRLTEDPTDSAANRLVGVYYCFVKERWDDGLPMLAQGDDLQAAELARVELSHPIAPDRQIALADAWWTEAEARSEFQHILRRRAAFWYQAALANLPPGLDKLRAEMRLRQIEEGSERR